MSKFTLILTYNTFLVEDSTIYIFIQNISLNQMSLSHDEGSEEGK